MRWSLSLVRPLDLVVAVRRGRPLALRDGPAVVAVARFRGIVTRETIDLMSIAVVNGDITAGKAFDLMRQMADRDRCLRLPGSAADFLR